MDWLLLLSLPNNIPLIDRSYVVIESSNQATKFFSSDSNVNHLQWMHKKHEICNNVTKRMDITGSFLLW